MVAIVVRKFEQARRARFLFPLILAVFSSGTHLQAEEANRFIWIAETDSAPPFEAMRTAGFNGAVLPGLREGLARYPSQILPVEPSTGDRAGRPEKLRNEGFEVAVYLQTFIQGGDLDNKDHLANRYPEWVSHRWDGRSMSALSDTERIRSGVDGVFLDPGIARWIELLEGGIAEILKTQRPNWLILDHVRYPIPEPGRLGLGRWEQPFGYHPASRGLFETEWGVDPVLFCALREKGPERFGSEKRVSLRRSWDDWRRGRMDDFVSRVRRLVSRNLPACRVAVVGYPDPSLARRVGMQDWPKWIREDWVDAVILPENPNGPSWKNLSGSLATDLRGKIWYSGELPTEPNHGSPSSKRLGRFFRSAGSVLFDSSLLEISGAPEFVRTVLEEPSADRTPDPSPAEMDPNELENITTGAPTRIATSEAGTPSESTPTEKIRALYGFDPDSAPFAGLSPSRIVERLTEFGFNAVFGGSAREEVRHALDVAGMKRYEEFPLFVGRSNWSRHPESRPIAKNGKALKKTNWYAPVCPNQGWLQSEKLERILNRVVERDLDGVWLDFVRYPVYWEEVPPFLSDTCFCPVCIDKFSAHLGTEFKGEDVPEIANVILKDHGEEWLRWRADRILEYVSVVRSEIKRVSPRVELGAFVIPWSETDYDGALYRVVGQDLEGFAQRVDWLSPMLYFHQMKKSPSWVSDRITTLSRDLRSPILPILQCYDEPTPILPEDLRLALKNANKSPSSGVILFSQKHLENSKKWDLIQAEAR